MVINTPTVLRIRDQCIIARIVRILHNQFVGVEVGTTDIHQVAVAVAAVAEAGKRHIAGSGR